MIIILFYQNALRDFIKSKLDANTKGILFDTKLYNDIKPDDSSVNSLITGTYAEETKRLITAMITGINGEYVPIPNLTATNNTIEIVFDLPVDNMTGMPEEDEFESVNYNNTLLAIDEFRANLLAKYYPLGTTYLRFGGDDSTLVLSFSTTYRFNTYYIELEFLNNDIETIFKNNGSAELRLEKDATKLKLYSNNIFINELPYTTDITTKLVIYHNGTRFNMTDGINTSGLSIVATNSVNNNIIIGDTTGIECVFHRFLASDDILDDTEALSAIDDIDSVITSPTINFSDFTNKDVITSNGEVVWIGTCNNLILTGSEGNAVFQVYPLANAGQYEPQNGITVNQFVLQLEAFVSDDVLFGNNFEYYIDNIAVYPIDRNHTFGLEPDGRQAIGGNQMTFIGTESGLDFTQSFFYQPTKQLTNLVKKITTGTVDQNTIYALKVQYPFWNTIYPVIVTGGGINTDINSITTFTLNFKLADDAIITSNEELSIIIDSATASMTFASIQALNQRIIVELEATASMTFASIQALNQRIIVELEATASTDFVSRQRLDYSLVSEQKATTSDIFIYKNALNYSMPLSALGTTSTKFVSKQRLDYGLISEQSATSSMVFTSNQRLDYGVIAEFLGTSSIDVVTYQKLNNGLATSFTATSSLSMLYRIPFNEALAASMPNAVTSLSTSFTQTLNLTETPSWVSNSFIDENSARVYYKNNADITATVYIRVTGTGYDETRAILLGVGASGSYNFTGLSNNTTYTSTAYATVSGEPTSLTSSSSGTSFTTEIISYLTSTHSATASSSFTSYQKLNQEVSISAGSATSSLSANWEQAFEQTQTPRYVTYPTYSYTTATVKAYNNDDSAGTMYITLNGVTKSTSVSANSYAQIDFTGLTHNTGYIATVYVIATGETQSANAVGATMTTLKYKTATPSWSSNSSITSTTANVYYKNNDTSAAKIYITVNGVTKSVSGVSAGSTGYQSFTGLTASTSYTSTAYAIVTGETTSSTSSAAGSFTTSAGTVQTDAPSITDSYYNGGKQQIGWKVLNNDSSIATLYSDLADSTPTQFVDSDIASGAKGALHVHATFGGATIYAKAQASGETLSNYTSQYEG